MARAASSKQVVSITNVQPTMLLMRRYGREFNKLVRDDVQQSVSPVVARGMSRALAGKNRQGAAVAGTFRVARDRFPAVRAFGARRVTSSKVPAGTIGFGANWGGGSRARTYVTRSRRGTPYTVTRRVTAQFGPFTRSPNDPMYGWVAANQQRVDALWQAALDRVYEEWVR